MGKFMILSSAVVLLVASLGAVQGLECYHCYDADFLTQEMIDLIKSTEALKELSPLKHLDWELSKSCSKEEDLTESMNKTCKTDVKGKDDKEAIVVCGAMTMAIEIPEAIPIAPGLPDIPKITKLTARGCLYSDPAVETFAKLECKDTDPEHFSKYVVGPYKDFANDPPLGAMQEIVPTVKLNVCTSCPGDDCNNPASAVSAGVLTLLTTLLVIPFTLH